MKNFAGKVAFVTGGASGIGQGMVRAFLDEGMKVIVADWNDDHIAATRALLGGNNAVHYIKVDVSVRADMKLAADTALATFGKIHVLCNNAGINGGSNLDDPEFEEWDRSLGVNLGGVVNGIKTIVPLIKAQGEGGHVVNTSSMAGMVPLPGLGAYSTAKYAVRGLTESLRLQLAPHGIGVSCLYPGAVQTAIVPQPPIGEEAPDPFTAKLYAAFQSAVPTLDMGKAVVQGIFENQPNIFTHLDFIDELRARNRALEEAFPFDQIVPAARSEFENLRRKIADDLNAMPVID